MYMSICLYVHMWNIYVPVARGRQNIGSDSLKLELQMGIDNHMDAGTSGTNPVTYRREPVLSTASLSLQSLLYRSFSFIRCLKYLLKALVHSFCSI